VALAGVTLVTLQCQSRAPVSADPAPAATSGVPQPATCRVQDMKRLREIGPALVEWSHEENLLLTNAPDDSGFNQVYVVRPDGSTVRCLSCRQVAGGPPVAVHKGNAHWHPSGRYVFLQVEMPRHKGNRDLAHPGSGRWNDLWATTHDGTKWWKLTDYAANEQTGMLFPVPSPDGRYLAWAERFAGPRRPGIALMQLGRGRVVRDLLGHWRLNLAEIVIDGGNVRLRNIRPLRPGLEGGRARPRRSRADDERPSDAVTFYEMQTWSPDSKRVYFAADIGVRQPYLLDIWSMDVNGGSLRQVVGDDDDWEEHVAVSPDGRKIAYMSSNCCKWNNDDIRSLVAEMYLMDQDGGNRVQLTRFNEEPNTRSVIAGMSWGPDGRRLAFARILQSGKSLADLRRELWMLTFEGPCGRS
jgi:Tol biopolymer transport system component